MPSFVAGIICAVVCLSNGGLQGELQSIASSSTCIATTYSSLADAPDAILGQFDLVFAELAKETGRAIVTESVPHYQTLTPKQIKELRTELKKAKKSEAVTFVATAFDYSIPSEKSDICVLIKRYSDSRDLPDITLQETVSGLNAFLKEHNALTYDGVDTNLSRAALKLKTQLTDANREKLEAGVLVKDLPNEVRPLLWSLSNLLRISAVDWVDRTYRRLKQCNDSRTVFRKGEFFGLSYPCYEGDFYPTVPVVKVALGWSVTTDLGTISPRVNMDNVQGVWSDDRKTFKPSTPDPTTPRSDSESINKLPASAVTLDLLVTRLKDRLQRGEQTQVNSLPLTSLSVSEGLRNKKVCVFGENFAKPYTVFKAVADLYELPLTYAAGNATLSVPSSRRLSSLADLPKDLRRLLPASFRRTVAAMQARGDDNYAMEKHLYIPAMRRLREKVEPKLHEAKGEPIPITEFDDETTGFLALTTLANATMLSDLDKLMQPYPEYLTKFSDAKITVQFGKGDNPRNVHITTQYTNPDTKVFSGVSAYTQMPPE